MTPETVAQQRSAVVLEAMRWLRTPYHHMGRVRGVGVDCAMLPVEVYPAALGWERIEVEYYPQDWHLHRDRERILEMVGNYAREIPGPPSPGDLVVFRIGRCYSHLAIVIDWPTVVHAMMGRNVMIENIEQCQDLASRPMKFFSLWSAA